MSDEFSAGTPQPDRLTQRREALGLTKEELAQRLGIDLSAIGQREHGSTQTAPPSTSEEPSGYPGVPRQLPAAVPNFTGRVAELDALTQILDKAASDASPGALVISAIGGTAGIGKTALALHWAHQVTHRFPDGQLHVNLRGFDPSADPMPPTDAIRSFLNALGVPPESIPRDAGAQAGLYRSLLKGKRMLIVLDNARDEQQVQPLLPASDGSLVLVTSRNQLSGLTVDDTRIITLDTLTHGEAVQMLAARLGPSRAADDQGAVDEITALCAGLPLALSVVAARVVARPHFPLASLAAELHDTAGRLDALDTGDPQASVQGVFSWSYDQLSPEAARMFRLLGLHPGPDISVDAAASMADTEPADARHQLGELAHGCLITEHAPGRYTFHDLLRAYAARQARTIASEHERKAALGRLFDHYAQTACAAAILLYPSREMITFAADNQPESDTAGASRFDDAQQARAWLEAEHSNLIASVDLASESGFDRHAWLLPWFLATHLARNGYTDERVPLQRTALAAATRLEDLAGQAVSNRFLGNAYTEIGEWDQALDCYRASAELYEQLGNRLGAMKAWQGIAGITGSLGRYAEALEYLENVRRLHQEIGNKAGEAEILVSMAWCHAGMAWDTGIDHHNRCQDLARRALGLATEAGNRYVEMLAWHRIAVGEHQLGEYTEAAACYLRALDAARKAGDRFHEADVLAHLGDVYHAGGDVSQARESWSGALAIFDDMQHPEADRVRSILTDPELSASSRSGTSPLSRNRETADQPLDLFWCGVIRYSVPIKQLHVDTSADSR